MPKNQTVTCHTRKVVEEQKHKRFEAEMAAKNDRQKLRAKEEEQCRTYRLKKNSMRGLQTITKRVSLTFKTTIRCHEYSDWYDNKRGDGKHQFY